MKKSDHVGRITESNYTKVDSVKQVFWPSGSLKPGFAVKLYKI